MSRTVGAVLIATALGVTARAQISPGELASGHAELEGSTGCPRCHEPGRGVSPGLCLECHQAVATRIAAGDGLHARPDYARCETCHVEHHGRDVDLVWWGEAGREAFDHAATGYRLVGKHAELRCEQCHSPDHVLDSAALRRGAANPARSYLGLPTSCTGCHTDPHRGQLEGECTRCHGQTSWRPAAGFDHSQARYGLDGRHVGVTCERCHPAASDAAGSVRRYRPLTFSECSDCHRDPHSGRLGPRCATCHTTAGWTAVTRGAFDHDRTDYPLRGRHADVRCERCHRAGRTARLPHARCADCHADPHRGEWAERADAGRCETCHDVAGFSPALFGIEEHDAGRYPLRGAHRAVACNACHARRPGRDVATLRPAFAACTDCHADPHAGQTARVSGAQACRACHDVGSWRRLASFDHGLTRFRLDGGHAAVPCAACHPVATGSPSGALAFVERPVTCDGCHRDPHAGQLVRDARPACERCHTTADWRPTGFDHGRDAAWALDGAHARVACAQCHHREPIGGVEAVRYKPLLFECRDCHSGGTP